MSNHETLLANKKVLLACSEMKSGALAAGLKALGASVQIFPVLSIRAVEDTGALDAALQRLKSYSWIIFTSAYGVHFFLDRIRQRGVEEKLLHKLQICAIGPATAASLERLGLPVSLIPEKFVAEGIVEGLAQKYGGLHALAGRRILIPRAKEARDLLPHVLKQAGACVDIAPCYENVLPEADGELIRSIIAQPPELVVFTSSSTVRNFHLLIGKEAAETLLAAAKIAVLGPITAGAVTDLGQRVDILPAENTIPSLLSAVRCYYQP